MRRPRTPSKSDENGEISPSRAATLAAAFDGDVSGRPRMVHVPRAVRIQRELWVEELVIVNTSVERIIGLARRPVGPVYPRVDSNGDTHPHAGRLIADGGLPGLAIGAAATRKVIAAVLEKLQRNSESSRPVNKALAEARLYRHIRDFRARGKAASMMQAERLLSDIQGTRAAIKVDMSVTVQTALINVLGSMTPEAMDALVAEYDELETKANDGSRVYVQTPKTKPDGKVYEVQGSNGAEYLVLIEATGQARCTCPDFQHRGNERPCKHIRFVSGDAAPQTGLR